MKQFDDISVTIQTVDMVSKSSWRLVDDSWLLIA